MKTMVKYVNGNDVFMVTVFGFGIIVTHGIRITDHMRMLRNDDKAGFKLRNKSVLFFTAPKWFNLNVYNTGDRGEK